MNAEVNNVTQSAGKKSGGGKKGGAKADAAFAGLDDEESLSRAIVKYAALTPEEKKPMLLKVKQAARADGSLQLSPDQQQKLDAEIAGLKK